VPPQFSAVKIDASGAYETGRREGGKPWNWQPARLFVASNCLLWTVPTLITCTLEMVCGQGVYVRSIARESGQALRHVWGTCANLRRICRARLRAFEG